MDLPIRELTPYELGKRAFEEAAGPVKCPYPNWEAEAQQWANGWFFSMNAQQK